MTLQPSQNMANLRHGDSLFNDAGKLLLSIPLVTWVCSLNLRGNQRSLLTVASSYFRHVEESASRCQRIKTVYLRIIRDSTNSAQTATKSCLSWPFSPYSYLRPPWPHLWNARRRFVPGTVLKMPIISPSLPSSRRTTAASESRWPSDQMACLILVAFLGSEY